ncbi:hypothetical protein FKM82_027404 [Ascaphus truei]
MEIFPIVTPEMSIRDGQTNPNPFPGLSIPNIKIRQGIVPASICADDLKCPYVALLCNFKIPPSLPGGFNVNPLHGLCLFLIDF